MPFSKAFLRLSKACRRSVWLILKITKTRFPVFATTNRSRKGHNYKSYSKVETLQKSDNETIERRRLILPRDFATDIIAKIKIDLDFPSPQQHDPARLRLDDIYLKYPFFQQILFIMNKLL